MFVTWIVALWAPLLVPMAPRDAPPTLREVVWPALRAAGASQGWTPRPVDAPPPGDAPALARRYRGAGVLWAEEDGDALKLRLYRAADDRVFETSVELPPGAALAAARDAIALELEYLLEARGGRPWRRTPPLPAAAPTIPAAHTADLMPPPRPPWPRRPSPVVPDPPPPLAAPPPPPGTRVEVTVEEAPAPPTSGGWAIWLALDGTADTDQLDAGFGLGARLPLMGRWTARAQGAAAPFAGDGRAEISTLHADLALGYRFRDAPVRGDAYLGAFYGTQLVGAPARATLAHRGGALGGIAVAVPVVAPLAVGLRVELLGGSNALEAEVDGTAASRQAALQLRGGLQLILGPPTPTLRQAAGPSGRKR